MPLELTQPCMLTPLIASSWLAGRVLVARPGVEYEFQHSVANAAGDVVGYIIRPITVREDCP